MNKTQKKRISKLEKENLQFKEKITESNKELKELTRQIKNLQNENEKLFQNNTDLITQFDQLQQSVSNSEVKLIGVQNLLDKLNKPKPKEGKENKKTNTTNNSSTKNLNGGVQKNTKPKQRKISKLFTFGSDESDSPEEDIYLQEIEKNTKTVTKSNNKESTDQNKVKFNFTQELQKYQKQVFTLLDMGFTDINTVLHALVVTDGDVQKALTLLQ
ncbi:ubiquitin-like protein [Anaeramoeba flamelloides]|uniref:Ubiquitin-like protein n=1 Tax=Anaeramoeba flamelloides TaxID=1746091 RepID=A0ABQ8YYX8_9EUKA|nr:ubiquitin-like protein [Anaeramoeba flamelloides]